MREIYDIGMYFKEWGAENLKKGKHETFTDDEINDFMCKTYKKYWITSYDYSKKKRKTYKALNADELMNKELMKCIFYINFLMGELSEFDLSKIDDITNNEIVHFEKIGGNCIYVSCLLAMLLKEKGIFKSHEIKLVHGVYHFKLREDFPSIIPFSENQYGLHTFLLIKDRYVIDLTLIPQQYKFFDFKEQSEIVGNIPKGINLSGYEEKYDTIKKYMKTIAKVNNISVESWIKYHLLNSQIIFLQESIEYLKGLQE